MNTNVFGVVFIGDTPHIVREHDLANPAMRDRPFIPLRDLGLDDDELRTVRGLLLKSGRSLADIQAVNTLIKIGMALA